MFGDEAGAPNSGEIVLGHKSSDRMDWLTHLNLQCLIIRGFITNIHGGFNWKVLVVTILKNFYGSRVFIWILVKMEFFVQ